MARSFTISGLRLVGLYFTQLLSVISLFEQLPLIASQIVNVYPEHTLYVTIAIFGKADAPPLPKPQNDGKIGNAPVRTVRIREKISFNLSGTHANNMDCSDNVMHYNGTPERL